MLDFVEKTKKIYYLSMESQFLVYDNEGLRKHLWVTKKLIKKNIFYKINKFIKLIDISFRLFQFRKSLY